MNDLERQDEILTDNLGDVMYFIAHNYNFNALVLEDQINEPGYIEWQFDAYDNDLRKAVTVAVRYYIQPQQLTIRKECYKKFGDDYMKVWEEIDRLYDIAF